MAMLTTRGLLIATTLLGGLMAGFNLDRAIVHNAAWHGLGANAWAAYSLHADLDIRAAMLYPFLGIGMALLSAAAAISFRRDRNEPRSAALPIHAGALFAISGLLMTFFAAPHMLSVPRVVNDPVGLQRALDGFVFWGDIRGALQILAFFANLWSLVTILSARPPSGMPASTA